MHRMAATCDVFITNKLPALRDKLGVGLEQIRAANPDIVYVRGTGQGERGPDADQGSYDSLAFWARASIAPWGDAPRVHRHGAAPAARACLR